MKALVCELCGGNELIKQDGFFVCQSCGTKYAPEEAKKLFVEISGTVQIDHSEENKNLLVLARRAFNEYANKHGREDGALLRKTEAEKYYKEILVNDANNPEARFVLSVIKNAEIGDSIISMYNGFLFTLKIKFSHEILNDNKLEDKEIKERINIIERGVRIVNKQYVNTSYQKRMKANSNLNIFAKKRKQQVLQTYAEEIYKTRVWISDVGDAMANIYYDRNRNFKILECASYFWDLGLQNYAKVITAFQDQEVHNSDFNSTAELIKKVKPNYKPPTKIAPI